MTLKKHKQEFVERHYTPRGTGNSRENFEEELGVLLTGVGDNLAQFVQMSFRPPQVTGTMRGIIALEMQRHLEELLKDTQ